MGNRRMCNRTTDKLKIAYDFDNQSVIFSVEVSVKDMEEVLQSFKDGTFDYFIADIGFKMKKKEVK